MSLSNGTGVVENNGALPIGTFNPLENLPQCSSPYWGVWAKERYTLGSKEMERLHLERKNILMKMLQSAPNRLKQALNFTFGLTDINGYSAPITPDEYTELHQIWNDAQQYSTAIEDDQIRYLINELYCIRETALSIPRFSEGAIVNESRDSSILRKYVYLDFFKFSLINELMRIDSELLECSSTEMAVKLVLASFLGTGSLVEKISCNFPEEQIITLKGKCQDVVAKIEESLELPICNLANFESELFILVDFIATHRITQTVQDLYDRLNQNRLSELRACFRYYVNYYNISVIPDNGVNPISAFNDLLTFLKKSDQWHNNAQDFKIHTRKLRASLESLYPEMHQQYINTLHIQDFFRLTTHPYFRGLLLEGELLSIINKAENKDTISCKGVSTLLKEIIPFYAWRLKDSYFEKISSSGDTPLLVLAHHVHNANINKLFDMMTIDRLIEWPINQQRLNISSSSSNLDVVRKEREVCLDRGYNYYRLHARSHLKAGNQNRSFFNTINCCGKEYYLTLDDDFFVFPDYPTVAHQRIAEGNLDYFQSPLIFKGIYKPGISNGEKADAEVMHYFESTTGLNTPRTFVLPRGTGTMFSISDGLSSVGDTGGFLIDFSAEDFGQGFLSLLQDHKLKDGKKHKHNPGQMSEKVLCIGEGVDLPGKMMQLIRWCHGTGKIYFHIFLPAMIMALFKGRRDVLMNKQIIRLLLLIPFGMATRFLTVLIFCIPFVHYVLVQWGVDIFMVPEEQRLLFQYANYIFFAGNAILLAASFTHYGIVQEKISQSPIRMYLLDFITILSSSYGYVKGMIGLSPSWWSSNKSRRIVWKHFVAPGILALMNLLVIIPSFAQGYVFTSSWASFNVFILVSAFLLLMGKEKFSIRKQKESVPQIMRWFNVLSIAMLIAFVTYLTLIIYGLKGVEQYAIYLVIILSIINVLITYCITSFYYLIKREKK